MRDTNILMQKDCPKQNISKKNPKMGFYAFFPNVGILANSLFAEFCFISKKRKQKNFGGNESNEISAINQNTETKLDKQSIITLKSLSV